VVASAGAWSAIAGVATDGRAVCGVITFWGTNRSLAIKAFQRDPFLAVEIVKSGWRIPAGTPLEVAIRFGDRPPWLARATGLGDTVEFTVALGQVAEFMGEFRLANVGAILFPSGDEAAWPMDLRGSSAAAAMMATCVGVMADVAAPPPSTQPHRPSPTQP
jgi:hypothetical protein